MDRRCMSVLPDVVIAADAWLLICRALGKYHQIAINNLALRAPVPSAMDEVGRPEGFHR